MKTDAPPIIDCHIHPAVDGSTETNWFRPVGEFRAQVEALRRAGIGRACGALVASLKPSAFAEIRALNDKALALRDRFPDFYIPGIQVHPHFPEESCAEVERCCGREGVRWVGELVGYMMGFGVEFATRDALTVMREIAKHRAAVNIHCHDLDVVDALCRAVPDLNVVLAHPDGDKTELLARIRKTAELPNLHLDISGSGIDRYGMIRGIMDAAGPGKALFGTDYPINNPGAYVGGAKFETLTREEQAALFHGNFLRLTGLRMEH